MKGWRPRADPIGPVGSDLSNGLRRLSKHMLLMIASGISAVSSETATAEPVAAAAPTTAGADADTGRSSGAKNTDAGTSESDEDAIPVVVVTAQKRKTKLGDTPVAVSAFTPEAIERDHIQGLDDVALRAPGVTFLQVIKGETYISIRGTLINTPDAGWADSVTTFIDDVPTTGVGDNSPDLYDLSSIEVLRGPQGTLFGRNVTGGAIVIHTLEPSFQEGGTGKIEGTYGANNLAQVRGLWTGPLIADQLAGKVTMDVKRRDDYLNNVTLHDKTYGNATGNGRGQLLWEPRNDLKVLIGGDFTHDLSTPKIVQLSGNIEPSQHPNLSYGPNDTNQGINATGNSNVEGTSARVEWDTSWCTLTSISGFRRVHDSTSRSRLGDPDNQALASTDIQNKQYTEEIHLASPSGQNLSWLGGLFYLHANKRQSDLYTFNLNHNTVNGGQFPIPVSGVMQNVDQQISNDVGALFGEASLPILDKLRLTLGARGQWESKSGSSTIVPTFAPGTRSTPSIPRSFQVPRPATPRRGGLSLPRRRCHMKRRKDCCSMPLLQEATRAAAGIRPHRLTSASRARKCRSTWAHPFSRKRYGATRSAASTSHRRGTFSLTQRLSSQTTKTCRPTSSTRKPRCSKPGMRAELARRVLNWRPSEHRPVG